MLVWLNMYSLMPVFFHTAFYMFLYIMYVDVAAKNESWDTLMGVEIRANLCMCCVHPRM